MGTAKVVFNKRVLTDVTIDTVEETSLQGGSSALNSEGNLIEGTAQEDHENDIIEGTLGGKYINSNINYVGNSSFAQVASNQNSELQIQLPNVTKVDQYSFYNCTHLTSVDLPDAKELYVSAFEACPNLSSINIPKVIGVAGTCFMNDTSLTTFEWPDLLTVAPVPGQWNACSVFRGCTNLTSVSLPKCSWLEARAALFYDCTNLSSVNMPMLVLLSGGQVFDSCKNLQGLVFPIYGITPWITDTSAAIRYLCIFNCTNFSYFDVNRPTSIESRAFEGCNAFETLVIRGDVVASLGSIDAFKNTKFAENGSGGTLYVRSDLVSSYQSSSNWSAILAYTNNSIKAIEGSYYETHYADGRLISEVVIPYPDLISLNGFWDYGEYGTVQVTNNNHVKVTSLKGRTGWQLRVRKTDNSPIFNWPYWSRVIAAHPNQSDLKSSESVAFFDKDDNVIWQYVQWYSGTPGPGQTNTGQTSCVDIYSIAFQLNSGVSEFDLEILLNDIRII